VKTLKRHIPFLKKDFECLNWNKASKKKQAIYDFLFQSDNQLLDRDFERFAPNLLSNRFRRGKAQKILHESETDSVFTDLPEQLWERPKS